MRGLIVEPPRIETIEGNELYGLATYMALREPMMVLTGTDEHMTGFTGMAFGLLDAGRRSLCLINDPMDDSRTARMLCYGGSSAREERVMSLLEGWRAAGSPECHSFCFSLHPKTATFDPSLTMVVLETGLWRLQVRQIRDRG